MAPGGACPIQPKSCPTWVGGTEIFPVPPFSRQVGRIFLRPFPDNFNEFKMFKMFKFYLKYIYTLRKGPHMSHFSARSAWILRGASSTCLCLSGFSNCRRCIVVTLVSTMLVPTAIHPRHGRLPFRVCEPMHFSGPPHLRAQAIVLHAGLEHCLQVVDEAYEALATKGVGCEGHGNGQQTQHERELRDEHAQHACRKALKWHTHERRLVHNHTSMTCLPVTSAKNFV